MPRTKIIIIIIIFLPPIYLWGCQHVFHAEIHTTQSWKHSQWWARRSHPEQESSVTWQQSQFSQCGDINNSSGGSHWLQDRGNKDHRGELNNLRAGGETVWEDKVSRRSLSRPTFQLNVNVGRHAKAKKRRQVCLFLDFHLVWHNRVATYKGLYLTSGTYCFFHRAFFGCKVTSVHFNAHRKAKHLNPSKHHLLIFISTTATQSRSHHVRSPAAGCYPGEALHPNTFLPLTMQTGKAGSTLTALFRGMWY